MSQNILYMVNERKSLREVLLAKGRGGRIRLSHSRERVVGAAGWEELVDSETQGEHLDGEGVSHGPEWNMQGAQVPCWGTCMIQSSGNQG